MGVRSTHASYDKAAPKWQRVRDICGGQDAMVAAGERYLPKLRDQSASEYDAYLKRGTFYNASARTMEGLTGMLFRKPPKVDVAEAIKPALNDVDMQGTPFNVMAQDIVAEILKVGRYGILIDHPKPVVSEGPLTVAKAEQLGLRPSMQVYLAENILNWRLSRIKNQTVLSMVVLQETIEVPSATGDEFKRDQKNQYRVLDIDSENNFYRVRIFQIGDKDQDVLKETFYPIINGAPFDFIPFVFIGVDSMDVDVDEAPLIDLVNVNEKHWRVTATYEHGCHFTGLPTPVISGYSLGVPEDGKPQESFYIGSTKAWVFPDPNAKADYLEFTGQGLGALEKNLDRKEQQMAILGARMIAAEKKTAETATTASIHRTGENSILSKIAISVSLALTRSLTIFGQWFGVNSLPIYQINREFLPATVDAQLLASWLKALQAGSISFEDWYDLLQRGDLVDSEKTPEDALKEIQDGPSFAPAPVAGTDPGKTGDPPKNTPPAA